MLLDSRFSQRDARSARAADHRGRHFDYRCTFCRCGRETSRACEILLLHWTMGRVCRVNNGRFRLAVRHNAPCLFSRARPAKRNKQSRRHWECTQEDHGVEALFRIAVWRAHLAPVRPPDAKVACRLALPTGKTSNDRYLHTCWRAVNSARQILARQRMRPVIGAQRELLFTSVLWRDRVRLTSLAVRWWTIQKRAALDAAWAQLFFASKLRFTLKNHPSHSEHGQVAI